MTDQPDREEFPEEYVRRAMELAGDYVGLENERILGDKSITDITDEGILEVSYCRDLTNRCGAAGNWLSPEYCDTKNKKAAALLDRAVGDIESKDFIESEWDPDVQEPEKFSPEEESVEYPEGYLEEQGPYAAEKFLREECGYSDGDFIGNAARHLNDKGEQRLGHRAQCRTLAEGEINAARFLNSFAGDRPTPHPAWAPDPTDKRAPLVDDIPDMFAGAAIKEILIQNTVGCQIFGANGEKVVVKTSCMREIPSFNMDIRSAQRRLKSETTVESIQVNEVAADNLDFRVPDEFILED